MFGEMYGFTVWFMSSILPELYTIQYTEKEKKNTYFLILLSKKPA